MTDDVMADCMRMIEGKMRARGVFWNDALKQVFAYQLADWDDGPGRRAVNKFVFEDPEGDPARLNGIYRECQRAAATTEARIRPDERCDPATALRLFRDGFIAEKRKMHCGLDPDPAELQAFTNWARRLAQGIRPDGTPIPADLLGRMPSVSVPSDEPDPFEDGVAA